MLEVYIIAAIAVIMGAFMQGCLGFGFGMISVPLMLLVHMPPGLVIPLQIPLSMMLIVPLAWQVRHHFNYRLVIPLWVGALLGLPVGMWILNHLNVYLLSMSVGVILVFMPIVMLMGWSHPLPNRFYTLVPVGMMSAILQGSISISAPPIILFLSNQGMDKDTFRANILLYFGGLGVIAFSNFAYQGMYTGEVLKMFALLVCCVPIGGWAGARLSRRIPQKLFRTLTLMVSALMGALLLVRSLMMLLGV